MTRPAQQIARLRERLARLGTAVARPFATIRAQIVLLVAFATILISLLAIWVSTSAVEDFLVDRLESRFPETLAAKTHDVRLWFDRIDQDLRAFAGSAVVRQTVPQLVNGEAEDAGPRRRLREHMFGLLHRFSGIGALVVSGPNGSALVAAGEGADIAIGWPARLRQRTGAPPSYGVVERDGKRRQLISVPVPSADGAMLRAILHLEELDFLLATGITREPLELYIVDASGRYIAGTRPPPPGVFWYRGPAPKAPGPIATYENAYDEMVLGASRPVSRFGWTMLIEQNHDAAMAPLRALIARVFWIVLALALVLVAIAVVLALSIVRPLEALSAAADRAAGSETEVDLPRPRGARELRRLTHALNAMTLRLSVNRRELEQRAAELQYLSVTDGLTGLYNHRYFREQLPLEAKRARRSGQRLALILVDIDDFKAINDTFGHAVGDGVLRTVARVLSRQVRATDLVARYGGEEFGVITQQKDENGAVTLGEKIRRAVAEIEYSLPPEREGPAAGAEALRMTVSVGVGLHPPGTDTEAVFDAADAALYTAKLGGKNRVELGYARGASRAR